MNAIQFNFKFDPHKIHQEIQAIATSFVGIHSLRIKENALEGIHLIIPASESEKEFTYRSTPELDRSPYLQSVLDTFQCNKITYRVHNLKAGGKINLHRDLGSGLASKIVRIHIPVSTNDQVFFQVNGEHVCMQNGECWFADITKLHEVENRSNSDRLQLMIDCDLNEWWEGILTKHGVPFKTISEWAKYSLSELQKIRENLPHMDTINYSIMLKEIDSAIAALSLQQ